MKQSKLEIYETTITVYEHDIEEDIRVSGGKKGIQELTSIMMGGEFFFEGQRKVSPMYGHGHNFEKAFIVLSEELDEKQLSNVFISLGAIEASVSYQDVSGIEITEADNLALYKINADVVSDDYLGTKDNRIVAGTITTEDLIKEVQTPVAKPKAKKKSTRK